ncbi:hypothetical protein BKA67DRAFT_353360 [Truncatella angustata]|uniref:Fungal specific transcription factor n=1 Tax=Truncatella angustata TaxID=152316 RepID=A0A9P8UHR8_9PEZI|nr:uncharacterized protein BKA67DRAFT_353360 [Truncatella angustata]KAH6652355.1 hypothetical protein BKA67DRAFT_353360 [Truncatella angustata]
MGLQDSRWSTPGRHAVSSTSSAPPTPKPHDSAAIRVPANPAASHPDLVRHSPPERRIPERELDRYLKLVARLKWKLPFLAQGYRIATDRVGRRSEEAAANEIHFKIDFYEYYMHIERALVHLMGVFGIKVTGLGDSLHNPSSSASGSNPTRATDRGIRTGVVATPGSTHRFHANVLAALDKPDNPLHEALGQGEVRKQLARAKELRNRWKNADGAVGADEKGYAPAPLEAYNLERILEGIFAGFDQGHALAELYIQQLRESSTAAGLANAMDWDGEEDDWGFIADAMDWEAI